MGRGRDAHDYQADLNLADQRWCHVDVLTLEVSRQPQLTWGKRNISLASLYLTNMKRDWRHCYFLKSMFSFFVLVPFLFVSLLGGCLTVFLAFFVIFQLKNKIIHSI